MERNTDTKKQNTKQPKAKPAPAGANMHAETPPTAETPQAIGSFQLGEIAGQVTVRRDPESILLSFEFSAPVNEPLDVVIGPRSGEKMQRYMKAAAFP